ALEQQTATSQILRVISSSPTDVQPVFDAIAANAARLCDAVNGLVIRFDGELLHLAAQYNVDPERLAAVKQAYPRPPSRGALSGRAILTRDVVHVPDVSKDLEYTLPAATTIGYRSVLAVPMMHEGVPRGTILVARDVVAPFSDAHIALIQTFADQAVIAIENVRLFTELEDKNRALTTAHAQVSEALEQQTATSEILRVISSSPTEVGPTFDAIVSSGKRLSGARECSLVGFDGQVLTFLASTASAGEEVVQRRALPYRPHRGGLGGRVVLDRAVTHIPDVMLDREYTFQDTAAGANYRAMVGVPLLSGTAVIGVLMALRAEPGPFSDAQIALLQTFADQAVIAIENVLLFTETKEALEQQTATADILRVTSNSPTDVQPVLDAITRSAARLCEADDASVWLRDNETVVLRAHHGPIPAPPQALPAGRGWVTGRAVMDGRPIHVDNLATAGDEFPEGRAMALRDGHRTTLATPLLREGKAIGAILIRRTEVRPFSDKHIALLKTFADQAVIAIENVRLFKELEARNRDLMATSAILQVISSSPTNVQPVFDAIVDKAAKLGDGLFSTLISFDGELMRLEAAHNWTSEALDRLSHGILPAPPSRALPAGRAILGRTVIHLPDIELDQEFRHPELPRSVGFRSVLSVPMLRDSVPLGAISVARAEPGPFSDNQIDLLKTFADQAVIAIENVRLFTE